MYLKYDEDKLLWQDKAEWVWVGDKRSISAWHLQGDERDVQKTSNICAER